MSLACLTPRKNCGLRNSDCGFLIIVELRKGSQGSFLFESEIRIPQSAIDWYRRRDSNPHCLVSKTSASCPLGYAGIRLQISDFGLRIGGREQMIFALIRILHSAIRNRLVDLARFERATSTFAKSRSISSELQVLRLLIAECGLPITDWRAETNSFDNPHSEIRNPQSIGGGGRS